MKALLICPDERPGVVGLAESAPLSNIPILGKSLIEYWLAHLAMLGAKDVSILATDRANSVRALVGDGARWGLHVIVQAEIGELSVEEARKKYQANDVVPWLAPPNDIVVLDRLPNLPGLPIVTTYADWFAAARTLIPRAMTPDRIGVHELQPGVWVGLHTHIAPDAKLIGPCWIGDYVWIEAGAVVGPEAILEKEVFISRGAEISQSVVGPETFVGQFTEVHNSIAWGSTLINWKNESCLKVPDAFLLCSFEPHRARPVLAKTASRPETLITATMRLRELVGQWLASVMAEIIPPR